MDRNHVVTITELNLWTALTQADGFRCSENPLFRRGLSSLILVHLLLWWLLLRATCQLAAAVFECLSVLLLFPRRKRFCHQPQLRVLGFDTESSFIDCCLVCSIYAGGSCDSNVPFCDKCSTQLRTDLFVVLLLGFFA